MTQHDDHAFVLAFAVAAAGTEQNQAERSEKLLLQFEHSEAESGTRLSRRLTLNLPEISFPALEARDWHENRLGESVPCTKSSGHVSGRF
jgi:hypothetical protein